MTQLQKVPIGVRILSIILFLFSLFAFFGSLFMWGEGFLFSFPAGVDYTYPVTDILINTPATMIAAIGLWQLGFGNCAGMAMWLPSLWLAFTFTPPWKSLST